MSDEAHRRRAVVEAARLMDEAGLNPGTAGNASARHGDGMLITPSGVPAGRLAPADVVALDAAGAPRDRDAPRPSSEWRLHLAVYRARPGAAGIAHAHSTFATALACARRAIPAFHYMVAVAGGDEIPCAPYATFGGEALARSVVEALGERRACLLANHGQIATGPDAVAAARLAVEVEALARTYWATLAIGGPALLDGEEMRRVHERFSDYGPRPGRARG